MREVKSINDLFEINIIETKKKLRRVLEEKVICKDKLTQKKIAEFLNENEKNLSRWLNTNNSNSSLKKFLYFSGLLKEDIFVCNYELMIQSEINAIIDKESKLRNIDKEYLYKIIYRKYENQKNTVEYYNDFIIHSFFVFSEIRMYSIIINKVYLQCPSNYDDEYLIQAVNFNLKYEENSFAFKYLQKLYAYHQGNIMKQPWNDPNSIEEKEKYIEKLQNWKSHFEEMEICEKEYTDTEYGKLFNINRKETEKNISLILKTLLEIEILNNLSKVICNILNISSDKLISQSISSNNRINLSFDKLVFLLNYLIYLWIMFIIFN